MGTLRRRWRLVLGILTVVAVIVAMQFISNPGIKAGLGIATLIFVVILVISGTRKGGGGPNPWHYQGGNTGSGGL